MDKTTAATNAIIQINSAKVDPAKRPNMVKAVCAYFDIMKGKTLSEADKQFLHYLANQAGIPQYYFPMLSIGEDVTKEISLQTLRNFTRESSLVVGEGITLHLYQKEMLDKFNKSRRNRYFLSAATSFGKTFLVYEILRKMEYTNVAFIFPTISLLGENLLKIHTKSEYNWVKNEYTIHTLSESDSLGEKNLYIFTPERFLSFLDKNKANNIALDFVFVDEVYKLDNGFIIDEVEQENERDVAYRVAIHELLRDEDTDALLVGPYINLPLNREPGEQTSFTEFLKWYGFCQENYNHYDIVNKTEFSINQKRKNQCIEIDDTFSLHLTSKDQKKQLSELVDQLLSREENSIIYCSTQANTEKKADQLLSYSNTLKEINSDRLTTLIDHICNLFENGTGAEWIVTKALKKGIGIHHGLIPKYIQQEIISLFNDGILKVLICTTTITEGVNTTAKNMIVLSGKKGKKPLKKFDAQNIEGRAGRFMRHYSGRVFILDQEFIERINSEDEVLQHKLFDKTSAKTEVDIVITESQYLTSEEKQKKEQLEQLKTDGIMPQACFEEFRTISYEDKKTLYDRIVAFSDSERNEIKAFIKKFTASRRIYWAGLELICQTVKPIIKNSTLSHLLKPNPTHSECCTLVLIISAFVAKGFVGSVAHYIKQHGKVDTGIREAARCVFVTLRYQAVKYLGLFNLIYKHYESTRTGIDIKEITGIDALLLRLEYSADTQLGRRASDIGASFRVIDYYDAKEKYSNQPNSIRDLYSRLDPFERYNVSQINKILGES